MTRILARLTLTLALVLGAAGVAVGAIGISDAHRADQHAAAANVAAARDKAAAAAANAAATQAAQSAANAQSSIATITGMHADTSLCDSSRLTSWNTTTRAAAEQAEADGNTATYVQYIDEVYLVDLICGTNFAAQLPNGA